MEDNLIKTYNQLTFYKKNNTKIQLQTTLQKNITFSGKINKSWRFGKPFVIMRLDSGTKMKIYVEDIKDGTIFPSEVEITGQSFQRKSIPQSIRMQLWDNYFGDRIDGKCNVCKDKIEKDNFEAGHVIAYINGGEDKVENLRPLCRLCNRSMGTQNLDEFKEDYN